MKSFVKEERPKRKFAGGGNAVQGPVPRASRSLAPNNCRGMPQKALGHSAPATIIRIKLIKLLLLIKLLIIRIDTMSNEPRLFRFVSNESIPEIGRMVFLRPARRFVYPDS